MPEATTGGELLTVQYGHLIELGSAGEQTVTLRLPDAAFAGATLDALVSGQSGNFALKLDIGNDGSWDWQTSGDGQPQTLNSPDLAAAFNAYRAAQGRSVGETLDVPVRVSLDTAGQVLLTNMVVEPVAAGEVAPTLSDFGTVEEGESITLEATINNSANGPITGATVSFHTTLSDGQNWYIGSTFLPTVPANGSATAAYEWNTLGFTGTLPITATVDPYNRIVETVEDDNAASANVTILAQPDMAVAAVDVGAIRQGLSSSVEVTIRNSGGITANGVQVALYDGDPTSRASVLGSTSVDVPANGEATAMIAWTPAARGTVDLHLLLDSDDSFDERNELDNVWSAETPVGWGNPHIIDATGTNDQLYNATDGYGYLTAGNTQNCGDGSSEQTYREGANNNPLQYRFDHLLPDRFYHVDLTFYVCSGTRTMAVSADGATYPDTVTVNQTPRTVSFLLDKADYADGSTTISILETSSTLRNAVVSEIYLTDIRYCEIDSGGGDDVDPAFENAGNACGYTDSDSQTVSLDGSDDPAQTIRFRDGSLTYRFDNLNSQHAYTLKLTMLDDGSGRQQTVSLNGQQFGGTTTLTATPQVVEIDVPAGTATGDSLLVTITELTGDVGVLSEITLEQVTPSESAVPTVVGFISAESTQHYLLPPILITVLGIGLMMYYIVTPIVRRVVNKRRI